MEIELPDVSGLPDALKTIVADKNGKPVLDLTKVMPFEDVSGLKSALQKERENLEGWRKYGSPKDVAAKIADLEEKAAKGGKGGEEAQAKLDAMKAEYEAKIAERDNRFTAVLRNSALAELKAELAKVGFIPDALDDIAATAIGRIQFHDDGTRKVTTADGKPMLGSGADHGATLQDLAKELAQTKRYAVKDGGVGGGGKPPGSNGGKPDGKTATRQQWDDMSQHERMAFSKSGGKVVD